MSNVLKIAIIGDFNFTYNAHHATNLALDHASRFLETEINYYWIKLTEASQLKSHQLQEYDGIWISPGPYKNVFFLNGIIDHIVQNNYPTFITGEGFKSLVEVLVNRYNLNPNGEKLISDNLVEGEQFEKLDILPQSEALLRIYENHSTIELTSSRYSLYPQLVTYLLNELIDIEGYNQFEEAEIISMKNRLFFVACGFCPQISSTREIPHPLIYTFIKACIANRTSHLELRNN
jgi:CTP synthase (UTP-ammonia lyase)